MSKSEKLGYCETCAENTQFRLVVARPFRSPGHWITTRLNLGPWYCGQCRVQRWAVHKPLLASVDHQSGADGSVSVGNFIRGDANLVMQNARSSRYSQKFRSSVVQRVLEGKHSLAQIASELEVPQADILVWVAQEFDQKQNQIEHLRRTVEQLRETAVERPLIRNSQDSLKATVDPSGLVDPSDVIEGRVN